MTDPAPPASPARPTASVEGIKAQIDTTKLLITLSTGAVAFTVTFLDKFQARGADAALRGDIWLFASWLCFGVSIVMAVLTVMALVGTLDAIDRRTNDWPMTADQKAAADGSTTHVAWSARFMVFAFLAGIAAMVGAGVAGR